MNPNFPLDGKQEEQEQYEQLLDPKKYDEKLQQQNQLFDLAFSTAGPGSDSCCCIRIDELCFGFVSLHHKLQM